MSDFKEFTYQHTCKRGQNAYIIKNSPFLSRAKKKGGKIKLPFLGQGYYFWEENLDAAIRWGIRHYNDNYSIVEYQDCKVKDDHLLDFLNRRDIKYFKELIKIYTSKRPKAKNWRIAQWIEFFKTINEKESKIFPFNYIRANEHIPGANHNERLQKKSYFVDDNDYYTFLDPLLIVCVVEKAKMQFKANKVIDL